MDATVRSQPATDTDQRTAAQPNLQGAEFPFRLGLAVILTGLGSGLAGGLLMRLLRLVQHLCYRYSHGDFLHGVEGVSGVRRVLVLTAAGILAGVVLTMVRHVSDSKGPGLTEAIWQHDGDLPQKSMSIKAVLSVVIVGMGAAIGREAALKQAGGLVAAKVADWTRFPPQQRKLLVACGVGAGMAAAYNVPLGGALFTLEVLLGTVSLTTAIPAFATSFIATAVSWLLLPNAPTYQIPILPSTPSLLLWALVCGPLLGLATVIFARGLLWAGDHKPKGWRAGLLPVVAFVALGLAAIRLPELLGNGKNVVQLAFDANMSIGLLGLVLVLRPIATMLCLRAGAPGGLFTPTMTFGAVAGSVLGEGWSHISSGADKRSCAIIGAGAVLAAATQAPISSSVFLLELTYNANSLMVPLLLAVAGATYTYHRLESRTTY